MNITITKNSEFNEAVQAMSNELRDNPGDSFAIEFKKLDKKMTITQQGAIHLYCENVASALNDAGLTVQMTMKHFRIPWSQMLVKELMYKSVLEMATSKKSTTEQTTIEPSDIYDVMNIHLSEKGIHVPFPSRGNL